MSKTKWTPKPKDTGTFSVWLMLPCGAYAVARRWPGSYDPEADPRDIMVRARKRKFLDGCASCGCPSWGPTRAGRARAPTTATGRSAALRTWPGRWRGWP